MVLAVRAGASLRAVGRQCGVSLPTVQRWVARARGKPLEEVDFSDRASRPSRTQRTARAIEDAVLAVRGDLQATSDLGEFGAAAIQRNLSGASAQAVPSVRTIGRILMRRGALDAKRRVRRRAPPPGWYLPQVASAAAELDSFDVVDGLVIKGGSQVEVFNAVSLHGGVVASWPSRGVTARTTVADLTAHWRQEGLPGYAQFDNDTRFQGPHQWADVVSRVMRLCLSLGVVPVFAPPRETGFQAAVESYNGRWQAKVWARFQHASLAALQAQSERYVAASRTRHAARRDQAPLRRPFPTDWQLDLQAAPQGLIIFLRRTSEAGAVSLLGHTFAVAAQWSHRLVRCEVDLTAATISCYALRRRDPGDQPLLTVHPFSLPHRPFRE